MQCPACRAEKETPQHFLLECPAYSYERQKLGLKKGEQEPKYANLISNSKRTVAVVHYMQATGRFAEDKQENTKKGATNWIKRNEV